MNACVEGSGRCGPRPGRVLLRRAVLPPAAALLLLLNGCVTGLIYTHVVEPLDLNARETSIVPESQAGDIKQMQYSIVDVRWDSNAIGDIAKREGIETVYFADMETFSLVLGIWRQRTVHIYGR
jgi:hypothetical protein